MPDNLEVEIDRILGFKDKPEDETYICDSAAEDAYDFLTDIWGDRQSFTIPEALDYTPYHRGRRSVVQDAMSVLVEPDHMGWDRKKCEQAVSRYVVWLINDDKFGVLPKLEEGIAAYEEFVELLDLHQRRIDGDEPSEQEWEDARSWVQWSKLTSNPEGDIKFWAASIQKMKQVLDEVFV